MPKTLSAVQVRNRFSQVISEAHFKGEPTVVTRNNKPVAAIIGYEEYKALLTAREEQEEREAREERFKVYDEVRARNMGVTPEQVEADVTEAVTAVRAGWRPGVG